MNKVLVRLNIVLLLAVGFLFIKVYSGSDNNTVEVNDTNRSSTKGKIAIINTDSLALNYDFYDEVSERVTQLEAMAREKLIKKEKKIRRAYEKFQEEQAFLTQEKLEQKQTAIRNQEQDYQKAQTEAAQSINDYQQKMILKIFDNIEKFLTDYNKDKEFSYVMNQSQALNIFFKTDSTLDITQDVIEGLNKMYATEQETLSSDSTEIN